MTLRDQISAAIGQAFSFEYLGEAVLYNGVTVHAIFTPLVDPKTSRGGSSATATLQLQAAQVPSWTVGDVMERNGESWQVKREAEGSTWYKHVLFVERDRRMKP
jgi:hypothetical protein